MDGNSLSAAFKQKDAAIAEQACKKLRLLRELDPVLQALAALGFKRPLGLRAKFGILTPRRSRADLNQSANRYTTGPVDSKLGEASKTKFNSLFFQPSSLHFTPSTHGALFPF